jgi:multiple sugar transport system permease protein
MVYFMLGILALLCVVPFYIMFINATRSSMEINHGISLLPGTNIVKNWINLTAKQEVLRTFFNSLIIAVSVVVLTSYFSALTAYGFSIYNFKGKNIIFTLFVMAIMLVPAQLGLIGFYQLCYKLGMLDTYWPLILPVIANPFAVFFLRQYMLQVVNESVIQAGRIDGATELGIFHRIIFPIAMPGIAVNAIFAFVGSWNNYILPLVILATERKKTMPMMIAELNTSAWRTDFGVLYLGVAVSVIPILIVFAILSKRILEGVAIGGTKE